MKICLNCQEVEGDDGLIECIWCGYKELIDVSVLIDMGRAYLSEQEKNENEWE